MKETLKMSKDLQDIFGKFLLSKAHITVNYCVSNEVLKSCAYDIDGRINYILNSAIVDQIDKIISPPSKTDTYNGIVYSKEFYAFNPKYFKEAVETIIRMAPEEYINNIRNAQ